MNQASEPCLAGSLPRFTPKQGQYLAFIHAYTLVLGRPPAVVSVVWTGSGKNKLTLLRGFDPEKPGFGPDAV